MDAITFINSDVHRHLVTEIYEEATRDNEIIGLLLQGSVARGDCYDTSDLDMYVLLKDGLNRQFHSEYRSGILVEFKYSDFEKASNKSNFSRAKLIEADLYGCNLTKSNFREADLTKAILDKSVLTGCDLRGARIDGVNLAGLDLKGVHLDIAQAVMVVRSLGVLVEE